VVISGHAYDVTNFIDNHPGGAKSLLQYGGKDGTEECELVHPSGTIEKTLSPGTHLSRSCCILTNISDQHLGPVDPTTIPSIAAPKYVARTKKPDEIPISFCTNLDDIESAAQKALSKRAWSYFHSAAYSLESLRTNFED
jgi:L-lactate dehydrogenase (cytochrome)